MEDLGSYVAEFSLIASITAYARASAVLLGTFIPHFFTTMILFYSFTWFYDLLVQRLRGIKSSFKFLYWKYFMISISMLELDHVVGEYDPDTFGIIHVVMVMGLIIISLYGIILFRHGWNLEQQPRLEQEQQGPPGMMQPVRFAWEVMVFSFNNGIGIIGMAFFSRNFRWKLVVGFILLVCILSGLVLLIFLDSLVLLGFFSLLSYVYFLWFRVQISFEPREEQDFPITMPIPLDILCFFLCYKIVVLTGMAPYVGGEVLGMLSWGFIMFSTSTIFFMYYYYYYNR